MRLLGEVTRLPQLELGLGLGLGWGGALPGGGSEGGSAAFLPYGSAHASVVFQHALTSNPNGNRGCTVAIRGNAAGPTHHATNGMTCTTGSADSTYEITAYAGGVAAQLNTEGQISFEIQTAFFTQVSAIGYGSSGDVLATAEKTALGFSDTNNAGTGYAEVLRCNTGTGKLARLFHGGSPAARQFLGMQSYTMPSAIAFPIFHTHAKPATGFTTVNVGWGVHPVVGACIFVAVNGVTVQMALRTGAGNPFATLTIGGWSNWFSSYIDTTRFLNSHYIRNLQVSTLVPTWLTTITGVGKDIAVLSDSIFSGLPTDQPYYDVSARVSIYKTFERRGLRPNSLTIYNLGGATAEARTGQGTASGAQTDATGYAFGLGTITLRVAGTGSIVSGDNIMFAGDPVVYSVTSGDADVSNGGTVTFTPTLQQAIPAAFTAITVLGNDTKDTARATVRGLSPTAIVYNLGSNDVGVGSGPAAFRLAVLDDFCYFHGLNGTSLGVGNYSVTPGAPGVAPHLFITNIIDRDAGNWNATNRANAATMRGYISALATDLPSIASYIHVVDTFNATQGTTTYTGKFGGDGIHLGYAGNTDFGAAIASAISAATSS